MALIEIKNKAQIFIDNDLLEIINNEVNFPLKVILLIFNDSPIENYFNYFVNGMCTPKTLIKNTNHNIKKIFRPFNRENWDCGIAISKKACNLKEQYPAYFTYLLGHEFGHAYICLKNIKNHVFSILIQDFIQEASNNIIINNHELPHEKLCDQFGIYIAEKIFSREILNNEITKLLEIPERKDRERLKHLLKLSSCNNLNDVSESLAFFSKPYKDKLFKLWENEAQKYNCNPYTKLFNKNEYESFFDL